MSLPSSESADDRALRSAHRLARIALATAVPLLALSILALAVFYAAPVRFGAWLARLPGDTYLRTALIFAPASLLAVVILATLYLRDSAAEEPSGTQVATGLARVARISLAVTGPLLALVGVLRAAAYLDPERVHTWLEALPGTSYLTQLLELAPLVLALAAGVALLMGFSPAAGRTASWEVEEPRAAPTRTRARIGRLAAEVALVVAAPALLLSLLGLGLQILAPGRWSRLLEPLPGDAYLRLLLTIAPVGLLAVLLTALLYLLGPLDPGRTRPVHRSEGRRLRLPQAWRSDLAMVVLLAGLVGAVAAGAMLVGGVLVLLVVR